MRSCARLSVLYCFALFAFLTPFRLLALALPLLPFVPLGLCCPPCLYASLHFLGLFDSKTI